MQPFLYERAESADQAVRAVGASADLVANFIAGGTTITDLIKLGVMRPERLVDINALAGESYGRIEVSDAGLRLGALLRMGEAQGPSGDQAALSRLIAESLQLAASQQIRNMASLGGNVLQRTRCEYFREISWPCNKRRPGSGCWALEGINCEHAVLGTSEHCIATYPGNFGQALIALDAAVETLGPAGKRRIPFGDRRPGNTPYVDCARASRDDQLHRRASRSLDPTIALSEDPRPPVLSIRSRFCGRGARPGRRQRAGGAHCARRRRDYSLAGP
jgi:xanthine dehydrogenase YagS FAD-binding subunit